MSGRYQFGLIGGAVRRILSVKSSRGVSFTLSILSLASKPLGYLRTLLIAWSFGTSAGMDAFHLASGVVSLVAGSIGGAMENAVLPELARLRKEDGGMERCRAVFAFVAFFLIFIASLFSLAVIVAPGLLIRFFAGGFDAERIRMGAVTLWWLLPFAVVTICRPGLETWALFTERYTVSGVTAMIFNFVAIPALIALTPLVGSYAVAGCMSIGHSVVFLLFFLALRGVPLRVRREALPTESLQNIGRNSLFSLLFIILSGLLVIVDRYFASLLPVGSVSAISYGSQMIGIISLAALTPLTVFLAKISAIFAEDPEEARRVVRQAISLTFAFFIPVFFFTAAAAKSIVALILGWGNFGLESVSMTSICLATYSIGALFSIAGLVLFRYAQASQRIFATIPLSVLMILTNGALDWLFVSRWGLLGLASATTVVQLLSFLLSYKVLMRDSLILFLREAKFFQQITSASLFAGAAWWCGRFGMALQLAAAILLGVLYLLFAERSGFMSGVPEHWRPTNLLRYAVSGIEGFLKR